MNVTHEHNWSLVRSLCPGELGRTFAVDGIGPLRWLGISTTRPKGPAAYLAGQTRSGELAESTVRDPQFRLHYPSGRLKHEPTL